MQFHAARHKPCRLLAAKTNYSGSLNLHAIGPHNITPIIKAYRERFPGVQISVTVGDSQSITQRILNYEGDIGLVLNEITDPHIHCLPYREQLLVIFAATGPGLVKLKVRGFTARTFTRLICRTERKTSPFIANFLETARGLITR